MLSEAKRDRALGRVTGGSGGTAPSGVQGRSPVGGLGGRSPPENLAKIEVF